MGIDVAAPRLSWVVEHSGSDVQTGSEVEILRDGGITRHLSDARSTSFLPWPAAPLRSRERAVVRVRSRLESGWADWSDPLPVEAGLLERSDWASDFVSPSLSAPADAARPAYLLRAAFAVRGTVRRARVYASAHGVYDLEVNGGGAGDDDLLSPGWSSYAHRLRYRTLDITGQLADGENVIGAWLADGWYRGRLGFNGGLWNIYGSDVALLCQLELEDDLGARVVPLTWTWAPAPIVSTGLYEGETHDQGLAHAGWSAPGFDDSAWQPTSTIALSGTPAVLEAPTGPAVRVVERLNPVAAERRPDGRVLLDFGQNISGKLEFTARATPGHQIVLRHAEVLEHGELSLRPLRTAQARDVYVFGSDDFETWTPRFTIHGFRYAEVEGWPVDQDPRTIEALVMHSDMSRTGRFSSSDELLDRFHENVVWSMRDNFVDLPTDCPQRDERLGWSGDIQVFAAAAAFLHDSTGVLQNWLRDLAAEQIEYGSVMNFHPWVACGFPSAPAAAWGDAAVIVPWVLYQRTGDTGIIQEQFGSMSAWIEQVYTLTHETGLWNEGFQLGDWLDPAAPPDRPDHSATDRYLVATAYLAHSARLVARAASALGDPAGEERYSGIADKARSAFRRQWVSPAGRVVSDTVTALSLAIAFELLEGAESATAGERLAALVAAGGYRIQTGFVGTPLVCDALASTGHMDDAYHLVLQRETPSWLWPVSMGATTVWERWDSLLPDGSVNPGEMTSFNHYALGAVVDFLHRRVAGLAPAAPGYSSVRFAPEPGGGLSRASAAHESSFGRYEITWVRDSESLAVEMTVPAAGEAVFVNPTDPERIERIGPGTHVIRVPFRAPEDDPRPERVWNIHNPDERRQMELEREGVGG
ncbi:family 78 glycoside hydrolase catalytic domain [Herbiconiux sp. 11R-BC]|uniref:family 78 glycoside hydrolase catalytic domain n=1 Tax=Herbiconiux sp. 11R-BC TaxID=3111637 RepID=UPI003C0D928B